MFSKLLGNCWLFFFFHLCSKCSRSVHYNEASMSLHTGNMDTSVSPRFCDVPEVAYSHLCAVADKLKLASKL